MIKDGRYGNLMPDGRLFGGFFENSNGNLSHYLWVWENRKWGLVDAYGQYVLPPQYDHIEALNPDYRYFELPSAADNDKRYLARAGEHFFEIYFENGHVQQRPFTGHVTR